MSLYEAVADLPLRVERVTRSRHERDTSSDFRRVTTVFAIHGPEGGSVGRGEDVTYDAADHDALDRAFGEVEASDAETGDGDDPFGLAGEYTFGSFSDALDDVDLFPAKAPERETAHHYRRWAFESAGLDLALRQAETSLAAALDRELEPVTFVASTRLGDPPSLRRVDAIRARNPGVGLKLDPTPEWDDDLVAELRGRGGVRVLDMKGHYTGTDVDGTVDPDLYRRVVEAFPEAVIEDPALTDETEPVLADHRDRIAWDAPITGVESLESLPFEPRWLNVKPSRFGTVESLFESLEWCAGGEVNCYGGGQFELDVGRDHIQLLASLFYPNSPNDVAPAAYNDPTLAPELPRGPLTPPANPRGLDW